MVRAVCPVAGCAFIIDGDSIFDAIAQQTAHALITHPGNYDAVIGINLSGGAEKITESEAQDGAGKLIPNDVERAMVKDSPMDDTNSSQAQKSDNTSAGSPKSSKSFVDAYGGGSWELNEMDDEGGEYEDGLAISKAMKEGPQENKNSNYGSTGLRDDEKITDSEFQEGACKLVPNDVEKSKVKDSQMDDTNSPEVEKSENTSKESSKSWTRPNVDDYSSLCWSCSKTKTEVKLYKCAGCTKAKYCSRGCIEHDWPHHKNWCLKQQKKKEIKKCSTNN